MSKSLNDSADQVGATVLVNCASQEYFGAVDLKALKLDVITPQFLEIKNGQSKMISFFAKKARGAMARYIVDNRVTDVAGLKGFDLGGYRFSDTQDDGRTLVFQREAVIA